MSVYNCKKSEWLYRSVKSIIDQSYCDWEFLICDDGSTDDTLNILKELEKLDTRIKVYNYAKNRGAGFAKNFILQYANGEYIAIMDEDDISHVERFDEEVQFLDQHKEFAFVSSIANVFNEKGIWGKLYMPEFIAVSDFLWNIPYIHPAAMFRKEALLDVGGYSVTEIDRRCEDYTLVMDLYAKGYKGYNIQKILLDYYVANDTKKYRAMKDRIQEARVRYYGYKKNNIVLKGIPYIIKPLIIGLIPQFMFKKIKEWQYRH